METMQETSYKLCIGRKRAGPGFRCSTSMKTKQRPRTIPTRTLKNGKLRFIAVVLTCIDNRVKDRKLIRAKDYQHYKRYHCSCSHPQGVKLEVEGNNKLVQQKQNIIEEPSAKTLRHVLYITCRCRFRD